MNKCQQDGTCPKQRTRSMGLLLPLALLVVGALSGSYRPAEAQKPEAPPTPAQVEFFETRVRPVFLANCLPCHSAQTHTSGLNLETAAGFRHGGDSGPLVLGTDPGQSLLIRAVRQTGPLKMPEGRKLKPSEIADLESWVRMGAAYPEKTPPVTPAAQLWSLRPVSESKPPRTSRSGWAIDPVDSFILADLEGRRIKPSQAADRRTLIRRVTYDLTGLPPLSEDVNRFVSDHAPGAYERVVDRLLASPRYGERWARHWLDVARYADTKGYVFNEDRSYPNAYTYRDWVIDAYNRDLPYDQFIQQQLAADLIPEVRDGEDKHPLAALGFLTVGRRFLNSEPDIIDDRIDVTMRGLEGFTVACARCHDHKFDPIPTQDYYSLYAVFRSSKEVSSPISKPAIRNPWEKNDHLLKSLQSANDEIVRSQVAELRKRVLSGTQAASVPKNVKDALMAVREEFMPDGNNLEVITTAFDPDAAKRFKETREQIQTLQQHAPPSPEFAMALEDRPDASDGAVFKRGNPGLLGEPAPRRFLLALSPPGKERPHWTNGSGRLDLAKAIASRSNPLTARVYVNRVWMHLFGAGLVRTPSDFGRQGEKPTNPQLLDYLAERFMDSGWSTKKLIRELVTSATYRQSSEVSTAMLNSDPENRLWGRMNRKRLDFEEMRDSLEFVAGNLDLAKTGGPSVDLWSEPFTNRRALYGLIERQNLPALFRAFDFATPDATSPRRFQTTVPQQALFFMNSQFAVVQSQSATVHSGAARSADDGQRVQKLYQDIFQRAPSAEELQVGVSFLKPDALAPVEAPGGAWKYGFGRFDPAVGRVTEFHPLAVFAKNAYHATAEFPDPKLGYVSLTAQGGHPGRDESHAAIRRWTAPMSMNISLSGEINHPQAQGDGVRVRIVSNRQGLLKEWMVHHSIQSTSLPPLHVIQGETIDFIVDCRSNDAYDAFVWSPQVKAQTGGLSWDATGDFGPAPAQPFTRLALYAQALLMANEFMFVD